MILLALAYFCYITNSVGLGSWLPKIVQRISGLSTTQVILISGIPWLCRDPDDADHRLAFGQDRASGGGTRPFRC